MQKRLWDQSGHQLLERPKELSEEQSGEVQMLLGLIALKESKQKLEASFAAFVRDAWNVVEPGIPLTWSRHYDVICEYLELAAKGEVRRLIVNVPPRTGKSTLITILWPAWIWTWNPHCRFLGASYALTLSLEHSVKRRMLIESDWYQQRWGKSVNLVADQNEKSKYRNSAMGQMAATGTEGSATGFGGDILTLDDGMSVQQASSDAERNAKLNWIENTWWTRFNDPSTGVAVIVEQRMHEDDISGTELRKGGWTHLCFPLVAYDREDEEGVIAPSEYRLPKSGGTWTRKGGDVLMKDRFTRPVLEKLQSSPMMYATQYQQTPAPMGGNIIRREWIQFYGGTDPQTGVDDSALPRSFDAIVISVDASFNAKANSDPVCIMAIGSSGARRYILEAQNARIDEIETESRVIEMKKRWGSEYVLVEDKANGPVIIRRLKRRIPGVHAINPGASKTARLIACSGEWAALDWFLPRKAPWVRAFMDQLLMFPNARHDDYVDAMTQAAAWLAQETFGFLEFWKKGATETKNVESKPVPDAIEEMHRRQNEEYGFMPRAKRVNTPENTIAKKSNSSYSPPVRRVPLPNQTVKPPEEACPKCESSYFSVFGSSNLRRCNACGSRWSPQ